MKDNNFFISGIQQVGVGTVDFRKSWNWYIEIFGTDVKILEDDTVAERMLPYTGGVPQRRHACIAVNLNGGGGLEIWQYSLRTPRPAEFEVSIGDLGIFAAKIKCRDVNAFYEELSGKWVDCGRPGTLPDGTKCLYVEDLYGNCFQIVEQEDVYIRQNSLVGGTVGAMIGVSDMEKSMAFYMGVLGYDTVIYDKKGVFPDWDILPGSHQNYRRVLLASSAPRRGAFSGLLPYGTIELVQALDRIPRKIYKGRYWGDPGFIQICYDVTGMEAFGKFCAEKGYPFTVDSCPDGSHFDMGDAQGHFTYTEDPDGTLIEFVETQKIPVVKKLGWNINMKRRNPERPLPKFLFRMMGLVSRQKVR